MPVSAYLKAGLFVVAAAAALFAAAGTVAMPGFWAYLAIFAVVMIVSFVALDPDLLRERMRPGGKKPPLAFSQRPGNIGITFESDSEEPVPTVAHARPQPP